MGQLRNGDGVTINEITVSHRALSNSPHDACTFDPGHGIRGVNMGGKLWVASEDTVIRTVNVSFDGVSVECNADFLLMLSDVEFRKEFVAKVKAEHTAKEAAEQVPHVWEKRPEKDKAHPGFRAWQCFVCKQWVSVKLADDGADEYAADMDAGKGPLGCTGVAEKEAVTALEAAGEKAAGNLAVDIKNAAKRSKRKGHAKS
jgi:hypothetical protein